MSSATAAATPRKTLDQMTSDDLDRLHAELDALRAVARGYCPACGRGDAAPTVTDWEEQKQRADRAETALARIAALADEYPAGIDTALIHEALDEPTPRPVATQATDGGSFPAHHDGPTVRECAEADRRWWGSEKVGE
jgi:hypothetical protein